LGINTSQDESERGSGTGAESAVLNRHHAAYSVFRYLGATRIVAVIRLDDRSCSDEVAEHEHRRISVRLLALAERTEQRNEALRNSQETWAALSGLSQAEWSQELHNIMEMRKQAYGSVSSERTAFARTTARYAADFANDIVEMWGSRTLASVCECAGCSPSDILHSSDMGMRTLESIIEHIFFVEEDEDALKNPGRIVMQCMGSAFDNRE